MEGEWLESADLGSIVAPLGLHGDGLGAVWGPDCEARRCQVGGCCKNRASDRVMMTCSGSGYSREIQ